MGFGRERLLTTVHGLSLALNAPALLSRKPFARPRGEAAERLHPGPKAARLHGLLRVCGLSKILLASFAVVFVLCFGFPGAALGAPQEDPLEKIRATMDEGQAHFLKGEYVQAATIFEAGYSKHPYSAFLFNAGVCYQRAEQAEPALRAFKSYLASDPDAPDAAAVRDRMRTLEAALKQDPTGKDAAGAVETPGLPPSPADQGEMKALVVVETEPAGASLLVYRRVADGAAPFDPVAGENPGWALVSEPTSPAELSLEVGRYHLVVEKLGPFNRSETDIDVSAGHVHHFKANLSQGAFLGFVKVSSNVIGATVFLRDAGHEKVTWGTAPHGELIAPGRHEFLLEAPGYEPKGLLVDIVAGDHKEVDVSLERVAIGILRLDATIDQVFVYEGNKLLGNWRRGEPALELALSSGSHTLSVRGQGYKDLLTTVDIPRGQILPVRATMIKKYPRGVAWSQAILAAGLIGAGIYFGVESDRMASELSAERAAGRLRTSDPRLEQGLWYSVAADSGFALGGTMGLLSLYSFLKDPYPESELRRGKKLEFTRPVEAPGVASTTAAEARP